jgi:hypothetical protein
MIETNRDAAVPTLDMLLEHLRASLTEGDVEAARSLARELAAQWPDESRVRYWARVLALPQVTAEPGEPRRNLDRERAWLRAHAGEYPGRWLAINGEELVSADRDLAEVLKIVRNTPGAERALIHYEPA